MNRTILLSATLIPFGPGEYEIEKFIPFDPSIKRTEATVRTKADGRRFKVSKGSPQIILRMAHNKDDPAFVERVDALVQNLADRGFRSLGVGIAYESSPGNEDWQWTYEGILSLFDPPRDDTKETIEKAIANGVEVKMITGDQSAIAKETCRQLGMGTNILGAEVLEEGRHTKEDLNAIILDSHGFAEVLPEHKFEIVRSLREQGFVTGMTGDGVNDAPALKRADIGIAVEGATDAARAASDIVLTEPGLSVIIDAIFRSRKIFQRMRNYTLYRIACTIQLLLFFFIAILAIRPSVYYGVSNYTDVVIINPLDTTTAGNPAPAFLLPVISLVVITILNDGTIITIAHDKVIPDRLPQRWKLGEVVIISTVLGLVACAGSIMLLVLTMQAHPATFTVTENKGIFTVNLVTRPQHTKVGDWMGSDCNYMFWEEMQTMMYLKISLSDFLTVFASRTKGFFFERRPGYALLCAFLFATTASTLLSLWWPLGEMQGLHGGYAALVTWIYCILWFFAQDLIKVGQRSFGLLFIFLNHSPLAAGCVPHHPQDQRS